MPTLVSYSDVFQITYLTVIFIKNHDHLTSQKLILIVVYQLSHIATKSWENGVASLVHPLKQGLKTQGEYLSLVEENQEVWLQ